MFYRVLLFLGTHFGGILIKLLVSLSIIAIGYIISYYQTANVFLRDYFGYALFSFVLSMGLWCLHFAQNNLNADQAVSTLFDKVGTDADKPVILFLRPFKTDGKIPIDFGTFMDAFSTMFFLGINKKGGLESRLRILLENKFLVVRIDDENQKESLSINRLRSLFTYRIGKYATNCINWKSSFENIAQIASAIVVVPPHSQESSTCEEIEHLINENLLIKTIFIMPKAGLNIKNLKAIFSFKSDSKKLWENLKEIVGDKIILPEYRSSGGFVIHNSGKFELIKGISGKPWYRNGPIKKIFGSRCLSDSAWLDSLRVTLEVVYKMPIVIFIFSMVIYLTLPDTFTEKEKNFISVAIILLLRFMAYYQFCSNFLLTNSTFGIR